MDLRLIEELGNQIDELKINMDLQKVLAEMEIVNITERIANDGMSRGILIEIGKFIDGLLIGNHDEEN